jgi:hypothetical protein
MLPGQRIHGDLARNFLSGRPGHYSYRYGNDHVYRFSKEGPECECAAQRHSVSAGRKARYRDTRLGLFGIFLLFFRKHYRNGFTNSDSNTYAQSNAYAHTNRDSYANSNRDAHTDSRDGNRSHQSHYFRATGKPQL